MNFFLPHTALYTDQYELTMAQGYFLYGKHQEEAVFDYFFRSNPYGNGFVVFAGLSDLLEALKNFYFTDEDISYLKNTGLRDDFLEYLRNFRFSGTIYSVEEGEIVFPDEPVLRVEGNLVETQLIESILLNFLNFESLIATKAARIKQVCGNRVFIDFGLRRAQGLGSIHASKACVIGGANATSNVLAGNYFNIPVSGTLAHSWIQSFDDELTAFRKYSEMAPENTILLVDTFDTLNSGVPNAITVAKEMEEQGCRLRGIRIDSGDLYYFSRKARTMLDNAGLEYVKIIVSNQLDEYLIRSLNEQGAPVDGFGVGTNLIIGKGSGALDGVYKLSMNDGIPRMKISENLEKTTLPGKKKIIRTFDEEGIFYADAVVLEEEEKAAGIVHPHIPWKHTDLSCLQQELITQMVMKNGKRITENPEVKSISDFVSTRLAKLSAEHKRFENPHIYKVGVSDSLYHYRNKVFEDISNNINK